MPTNFRKLQRSDLSNLTNDSSRLEQYIRGLERQVESMQSAIDQLGSRQAQTRVELTPRDLQYIRDSLQAGGVAELDLSDLSGVVASSVDARIPRVTAHPDPYSTPYDTYVLTGTPDTLWQIDRTTNPPTAVQLAFVGNHVLLSATHTDTVASAVSRGSLIKGNATPAWEEFVLGAALQLLRVNAAGTDLEYGAVDDTMLSANVALENVANAFTGANTFSNTTPISLIDATNGGYFRFGRATELLTLSTLGATTDTTANLLPPNALILAVNTRITTTISGGGVTLWRVGDATTSDRFSGDNANLTAGNGSVGLNQWKGNVATEAAGPTQTGSAKVRITCNGTPTAGVIRIAVFYVETDSPTS